MDKIGNIGVRHDNFSVGADSVTGLAKSTDCEFVFPRWELGMRGSGALPEHT